jgi:transposase InsO family protein
VNRFQFVDDHQRHHGVKRLCQVVGIARFSYYHWMATASDRAALVLDALHAAERTRGRLVGAIFHSDHGAQYGARAFAEACRAAGVTRSTGAVGSSADNAAAESLNASFKRETLQGTQSWGSAREARLPVFGRAHRYNTRRRHSHLGQKSPMDHENSLTSTPATPTPACSHT